MAKYIDAEKLIASMADSDILDKKDIAEWVNCNTADVIPVIHGEWLDFYGNFEVAKCSICGELLDADLNGEVSGALFNDFKNEYRYCPSCGARMEDLWNECFKSF